MRGNSVVGKKLFLKAVSILFFANFATAVSLPSIISNNMVLQRNETVPIWGWGESGEKITIKFSGQTKETFVDKNGKWRVDLEPMKASSSPLSMIIQGKNRLEIKNILIGEVWVCCGQSNMAFKLRRVTEVGKFVKSANCPELRLCKITGSPSGLPLENTTGNWTTCSPKTAIDFSAVGYFYGREIQKELNIPVGMIYNAVGGTRIQQWTPMSGYKSCPKLHKKYQELANINQKYREALPGKLDKLEKWTMQTRNALKTNNPIPSPDFPEHPLTPKWGPTNLFNALVNPIIPFAVRGVIWYQGESNWTDGAFYHIRMKALINGWRQEWQQKNLPFYFVQLPPHNYGRITTLRCKLPEIWDAQRRTLSIPDTGMAVTTDLGDLNDVHPKNGKDIVAHRLALWAMAKTYNRTNLIYSGPIFKTMQKEGSKVRINFDFAESGLKSKNGKEPDWFEIAGRDKLFVKANAKIDGNSVIVWNDKVSQPEYVRFGWDQAASPNLINNTGLPASPFQESILKNK